MLVLGSGRSIFEHEYHFIEHEHDFLTRSTQNSASLADASGYEMPR